MTYQAPLFPAEVRSPVVYTSGAVACSRALLSCSFREIFHRFIHGYESDEVLPACQWIAEALLRTDQLGAWWSGDALHEALRPESLKEVLRTEAAMRASMRDLHRRKTTETSLDDQTRTALILRHSSPAGLTEPCWLDNVSQPATQPARAVNALFRIYTARLGHGEVAKSASVHFRKRCDLHGVTLPPVSASAFSQHEQIAEFAFLAPCYRLALGRHPRLFLPEIIGTTLAHYLLRIDPLSGESDGDDLLDPCHELVRTVEKLSFSPRYKAIEQRILRGFVVEAHLQQGFWEMMSHTLRAKERERPRDRMCSLVQRIARYAGAHHRDVVFEGRPLAEWLDDAARAPAAFVDRLGDSVYVDKTKPGESRFFQLLSIDGPMFAIFSKRDGQIIKDWVNSLGQGSPAASDLPTTPAASLPKSFTALVPSGPCELTHVVSESAPPAGLRELFYRLMNVDLEPGVLPHARAYVEDVLRRAEPYLVDGRGAVYSDATFFDYAPAALAQRVDEVYFQKLVKDYHPIEDIPPRALVVSLQTMLGLGSLIDGAWIHKMGKVPQYGHQAAAQMFGIYADEMGYGDMRLNHIMVARRVLDSMEVELPEMADRAYAFADAVPEKCFAFLAYQMAISQFPQTFLAEGLGLNLAVEMFGLGQVRLDEIRKLRHYGFDDSYERLHLTIDNVFSGHVRVGVQAIDAYLDDVRLQLGGAGVATCWRRVWLGYASLAQFVEPRPLTTDEGSPKES